MRFSAPAQHRPDPARRGDRGARPGEHNSHFHFALELPAGRSSFEMAARLRDQGVRIVYGPVKHNSEPGGDGESGGNSAVYSYDPDGHYVEFFYAMDTIESYRQRYGEREGSER